MTRELSVGLAKMNFSNIESNPDLLAFAQSTFGKICLVVIFTVFLMPSFSAPVATLILGIFACSFAPQYRWHIVAIATLVIFALDPFWFNPELPYHMAAQQKVTEHINFAALKYGIGLFFFGFASAVVISKRRFKDAVLFRRPIVTLLIVYFSCVFLASFNLVHGITYVVLWSFIGMFGGYFWFLGYALLDNRPPSKNWLLQLGTFHPFWGSSAVPIGKGIANLDKVEAKDDLEFAVSRIKAVKLIAVCFFLRVFLGLFYRVTSKYFGLPTLDDAFVYFMKEPSYPIFLCWSAVAVSFVETIVYMALWGNSIVACARMAGFQLLQNTYKPLQSKTLAEFWNRYFFYFKELLVEFFFYPTFLRCFKRTRRVRIVFATFMAACVGNTLFHFMRDIEFVARDGLWTAIAGMQTYVFYCFVLTTGIAVSQLRPRKPVTPAWLRGVAVPALYVISFFFFLSIFDDTAREHPLPIALKFFFHLFGG